MRLVHKGRVHELATEERMWAGLWLQKEPHPGPCGGAYITEPCIQETTLAGMKSCDPARVPTCPL
jgi:hypothetical protein